MIVALRILAISMLGVSINHLIQTYYIYKIDEFLREVVKDMEEDNEIGENNIVEFVGEDSEGNGLYRIK